MPCSGSSVGSPLTSTLIDQRPSEQKNYDLTLNTKTLIQKVFSTDFGRICHVISILKVYSIIQPKIDYAISIWGYTTAHNINKVQRLQNRAARILTGNFDYVNTRGIDLVKNLGLMNVIQRRDYFMLIMMFKSIHGLVPDYICDQITMQRDITVRTTRSTVNNNVHVPHILLECCKNAFAYRGPVLWNALPENIKKCETLNCFKKCVKLHVVE